MSAEQRSDRRAGPAARAYAAITSWFRLPLLLGVVAFTVWLLITVKPAPAGQSEVVSMVPSDSVSLRAQERAARLFELPFASDAVIVQRDPHGLSPAEQRAAVNRAMDADRAARSGSGPRMVALAVVNTLGIVPGSRESSTAALTYLGFPSNTSLTDRVALAHRYAAGVARDPAASLVRVTGLAPANLHEGILIEDSLIWIEAATVVLVLLVVGALFRSLAAPILTLGAVGMAYVVALAALRAAGEHSSLHVPEDLRPL